jgi:hypothetical protein
MVSLAGVGFRTDSEPEPDPNQTPIEVRRDRADRTEPQVQFGVRIFYNLAEPE